VESVEHLQEELNELLGLHSLRAVVDKTSTMFPTSTELYISLTVNIEESESGERLDTFGMVRPFEEGYDNSSYQEFLEEVYNTFLRNWVVGGYKKGLEKKLDAKKNVKEG